MKFILLCTVHQRMDYISCQLFIIHCRYLVRNILSLEELLCLKNMDEPFSNNDTIFFPGIAEVWIILRQSILGVLTNTGYTKAEEMRKQAQYVWAFDLVNQERYAEAFKKFETIRDYADVKDCLDDLSDLMYLPIICLGLIMVIIIELRMV